MEKVAVIVPIYKEKLNALEEISLRQCQKILGHYPLFFVCPDGLSISYEELLPQAKKKEFDPSFFKDTQSYSRLLTDPAFYEAFLNFEYILIYQPDAYVFKDELMHWCHQGYDYIGSPKLKLENYLNPNKVKNWRMDAHLLNGGFSLRKVKSMIRFTKIFHFFYRRVPVNEDQLFSCYFIRYIPLRLFIHLPNWKTALKFGWEKNPSIAYSLEQELPFGCHAWEKYHPKFWKEWIEK